MHLGSSSVQQKKRLSRNRTQLGSSMMSLGMWDHWCWYSVVEGDEPDLKAPSWLTRKSEASSMGRGSHCKFLSKEISQPALPKILDGSLENKLEQVKMEGPKRMMQGPDLAWTDHKRASRLHSLTFYEGWWRESSKIGHAGLWLEQLSDPCRK